MKLPFTVGFELTGIFKGYSEDAHLENVASSETKALSSAAGAFIALDLNKAFNLNLPREGNLDGHCMEIASPVFDSYNKLRAFYQKARRLMSKYHMVPRHPDTVCGGNHLHFGIKSWPWRRAIVRDMALRPYIAWVFTQPEDTASCNNLWGVPHPEDTDSCFSPNGYAVNALSYVLDGSAFGMDNDAWQNARRTDWFRFLFTDAKLPRNIRLWDNKNTCIAISGEHKTVEFRCVEAPMNWNEFKLQLDFFIAYVMYIKKNIKNISLPYRIDLQAYKRQDAVDNFNALLVTLGLNPKDYAPMVRRNLIPRWNAGYVRQ